MTSSLDGDHVQQFARFGAKSVGAAVRQGYIWFFVDEGPAIAVLLREAAKHDITPGSIGRLQAAFGTDAVNKCTRTKAV